MKKSLLSLLLILSLLLCITCAAAEEWVCPDCGQTNTGNFCPNCGAKSPIWICPTCGQSNTGNFCPADGTKKPDGSETGANTDTQPDSGQPVGTFKMSASDGTIYFVLEPDGRAIAITPNRDAGIRVLKGGLNSGKIETDDGTDTLTFAMDGDTLLVDGKKAERTTEIPWYTVRTSGNGMSDTFGHGDTVKVEWCDLTEYSRGDIVAVHYPDRGKTIYVKRLVGLPGDRLELIDGYLYVNDEKQDEDYINNDYRGGDINTMAQVTLGDGEYFVLGDRRNASNDSRYIGPLTADMLMGKVVEINP